MRFFCGLGLSKCEGKRLQRRRHHLGVSANLSSMLSDLTINLGACIGVQIPQTGSRLPTLLPLVGYHGELKVNLFHNARII